MDRRNAQRTLGREHRRNAASLVFSLYGGRAEELGLTLRAANKDVDQVRAIWRLQSTLTHRFHELRCDDRREVGADQDPGNGPLDVYRFGERKQTRQLLQTSGVRKMLVGKRIEGADLRIRTVHVHDPQGKYTKLAYVDDRLMTQIDLRDLNVFVVLTRQPAKDPRTSFDISQAGKDRGMRNVVGLRR